MAYACITRMRVQTNWRHEALGLVRQLMALYMEEEECLFQGNSDSDRHDEAVKFSLWETKEAADAAAAQPRSRALRSQLMLLCEGPFREEAYELSGALRKQALASLARGR
ncbi:MAG: hypothetical protein HYX95_02080 [Chloroflexi bacterium]|nr:hypothetical protein [Chloroflexota bacterium]